MYWNNGGFNNTATGYAALQNNTKGGANTATGAGALQNNYSGGGNTATGTTALFKNTSGINNTAGGYNALYSNSTGNANTATGAGALFYNTAGGNTAIGTTALFKNTTGFNNTACGYNALYSNTSGGSNTATGAGALQNNTSAGGNTAGGAVALFKNTTGSYNTATGYDALYNNTTGSGNTAVGLGAIFNNTIGNNNIALGRGAGQALTTGSNNIDIGNVGLAAESGTIRIGTQGTQTATFVAGISTTGVTGTPVLVDGNGQLGVMKSSARFKRDIRDMGTASGGLMQLRPVTFRYKNDPSGRPQYGLVAEEVARIYPELVSYGADGKPETVNYLTLIGMLLNELQKQARENQGQARRILQLDGRSRQQADENRRLSAQVAQLKAMFEQAISVRKESQGVAALNRQAPRATWSAAAVN